MAGECSASFFDNRSGSLPVDALVRDGSASVRDQDEHIYKSPMKGNAHSETPMKEPYSSSIREILPFDPLRMPVHGIKPVENLPIKSILWPATALCLPRGR